MLNEVSDTIGHAAMASVNLKMLGFVTRTKKAASPKELAAFVGVGVTGFEPATFCTPCRRASQVTLHPDGVWPKAGGPLELE